MNIGIVTIYKCYNYGSFFQAYGLQKYLQDQGHTVHFLPLDSKYNLKYRLRRQFTRDLARDLFSLKLIHGYCRDWRLYAIAPNKRQHYDLIIIGSDELWNIRNKSFTAVPEYYGLNLPCDNIVSYASCVGPSTVADFSSHKDYLEGLKGLRRLSARDEATKQFLSEAVPGREIARVLDPSFLIDWNGLEISVPLKDYILVYTYDGNWGFTEDLIQETKRFAKAMDLPLVSVGFKNDWCDRSIACGPREFLGYLRNAAYVVTGTFHGTVMSIQYQKQFISTCDANRKAGLLLAEFGLTEQIYRPDHPMTEIARNTLDYARIDELIQSKAYASKCYLEKALKL